MTISLEENISWTCSFQNQNVIDRTEIVLEFMNNSYSTKSSKLLKVDSGSFNEVIEPVIPHKDARIDNNYNQLIFHFENDLNLYFRAFNDGVAYRFAYTGERQLFVKNETLNMNLPKGNISFFPQETSLYSHNERLYKKLEIHKIKKDMFCSLPVLFQKEDIHVLFTETALHDYPGMFLSGTGSNTLSTLFPRYVLEAKDDIENGPDRNQILFKKAEYIAEIKGEKQFPWRVFIITDNASDIVESNLTFQLSNENSLKNTEWIKPGKVAWDWYNANNIFGVDFKSGINNETYQYYIDFASKYGIEYVILDEGWTKSTTNILECNPEIDVEELITYGKERGVGIILWVLWKPLDANTEEILETYKSWGAKGVKVDFMQRNDQAMVSSYEKIALECAKRELIVDFHGAFKPSGLRRKYPNILNYEGVKGTENNKWSADITPDHNVTIPFIRMAAGPIDYTPGSMINKQEDNYSISFERPMSLGTRAHQVAMYVVYEAPLQMMCESPSVYYKEHETTNFIAGIPTVWDETIAIDGAVGEFIVVARRKGDIWYVGAMTNWEEREIQLDLSFLGSGIYHAQIFQDGINADRYAEDYKFSQLQVEETQKLNIKMASGGGWSAIFSPK